MWWHFLAWALAVYLAIGVIAVFILKQTPYAENPLWTMLLLWPFYLIGGK